jgi:hypothetical protein
MYIYIYTHTHTHTLMHVHKYGTFIHAHKYVYMHAYVYTNMYIHAYTLCVGRVFGREAHLTKVSVCLSALVLAGVSIRV